LAVGGGGGAGSNLTVSGLALAEPSTIFATTGSYHGSKGVIHRSDDGGHSWTVVEESDKPLLGISFHGKRGVAVGNNIAFWTADGGATWNRVAIPGVQQAVDVVNENMVVAVGNEPHVVVSRNGGKTWQPFQSPLDHGNLVDIAAVDAGWWFVAGGYGANALYHFVDPNHTEPIARGTVTLPVDVQASGGRALPRGVYEVTLGHRGDQHVVKLDRKGDVASAASVTTSSQQGSQQESAAGFAAAVESQKSQKPPACAQPCEITLPADVIYEKEDVAGRDLRSFFNISLDPAPSAVAIAVRTAVTQPRNVALGAAAVRASESSGADAPQVAKKAATKGGGLFGRIQKAAGGDLRSAVAGAGNPQATQQQVRAAKSAPPAVYKVTLRHSLDLFGAK
jgi:hypothetical protein